MWQLRSCVVLAGLASCLLVSSAPCDEAAQALRVGDVAPQFICLDDQGQLWNSRDHLGKRMLVVYFYASDFSRCCTRQAQQYRDRLHQLCDCGVEVVGISGDQVEAHRQFQQTHQLNFPLLSDSNGDVARKFGVPLRTGGKAIVADVNGNLVLDAAGRTIQIPRKVTASRWTFIVGRDGRILSCESDTAPARDSQEVLDFIQKANAE